MLPGPQDLFCTDLPTSPQPTIGKVLVAGATGYVGGRLVPDLLSRGYSIRMMVRNRIFDTNKWQNVEVIVADALKKDQLDKALDNVQVAYYLIHSLSLGPNEFADADLIAAKNFQRSASQNGVKRIIYLGGVGDEQSSRSNHLRNRLAVFQILNQGTVPVTALRAAIIIGSGSASYEIIKNLVLNLHVILLPTWAKNKCQPIAIRDVIKYLVGVLELEESSGQSFDIGGKDILTYEEMLKTCAKILGVKTIFGRFPSLNIPFYSYLASLFTPVPEPIISCLMEGLKDNTVCSENKITQLIPFQTLSYREAIVRALSREEQDQVYTRWSDAYPPAHELALKLSELPESPRFISSYSLLTNKSPSSLFHNMCKIGGKDGWFRNNWMWRLRGLIDRILLGVGTARGRKSSEWIETNDVIGFFRVEYIKRNELLLLRAEMKLPGRAWLEFRIVKQPPGHNLIIVTAYFQTKSILGRLYWYFFLPFHQIIFKDLLEDIDNRSSIIGDSSLYYV
jgi:uncharacterized protein YbjT (DUF2867 family)